MSHATHPFRTRITWCGLSVFLRVKTPDGWGEVERAIDNGHPDCKRCRQLLRRYAPVVTRPF